MEPKADELMLTPIEDLGFSHDLEQDDGEWDKKRSSPPELLP